MVFTAFVNFLGYQDSLFVARFAGEWRIISRLIRKEKGYRTTWAFLDRTEQCVKFRSFFGFGRTLARASVVGGEGYPRVAVVISSTSLGPVVTAIFDRILPIVVEYKTET